jgi:hypothetical protein
MAVKTWSGMDRDMRHAMSHAVPHAMRRELRGCARGKMWRRAAAEVRNPAAEAGATTA